MKLLAVFSATFAVLCINFAYVNCTSIRPLPCCLGGTCDTVCAPIPIDPPPRCSIICGPYFPNPPIIIEDPAPGIDPVTGPIHVDPVNVDTVNDKVSPKLLPRLCRLVCFPPIIIEDPSPGPIFEPIAGIDPVVDPVPANDPVPPPTS